MDVLAVGVGEEEVCCAGVGTTTEGLGDDGTVFVATVDFELGVVAYVDVVELFVGFGVNAEAVEPFAADTGVADNVEGD